VHEEAANLGGLSDFVTKGSIAAEILVPLQLEAYVWVGIGAEQLSLPPIQLMCLLGLGSIRVITFCLWFVSFAGSKCWTGHQGGRSNDC
jgi:hypothetical protein